jgi:hypothetical protein
MLEACAANLDDSKPTVLFPQKYSLRGLPWFISNRKLYPRLGKYEYTCSPESYNSIPSTVAALILLYSIERETTVYGAIMSSV